MKGEKYITVQNLCAGWAMIWGIYAAWPYTDLFQHSPRLYEPMFSIVSSEAFWGGIFGGGGLIAGYYSFTGRRTFASLILGNIFISFSVLYFMGDPISPGGSIYALAALMNFIFYGVNRKNG